MKRNLTPVLILSCLALAACGGGSSSGTAAPSTASNPPSPPPPPPPPNEAPTLAVNAPASIPETALLIATISAADPDDDTLSFSVTGPDAGAFQVTEAGELVVATPLDFETPSDTDQDNRYSFTVMVDDGNGGTASEEITLAVDDVPRDGLIEIEYANDVNHRAVIQPSDFGDAGAIAWGTNKLMNRSADVAYIAPVSTMLSETHARLRMGDIALTLTVEPGVDYDLDGQGIGSSNTIAPQTVFVGRNRLGEHYLALSHTPVEWCLDRFANDTSFTALVGLNVTNFSALPNPLDLATLSPPAIMKRESENTFRLGGAANSFIDPNTMECQGLENDPQRLNRPVQLATNISGDFNGDGATDIVYTRALRSDFADFIFVSGSRGPVLGESGMFDMQSATPQSGEVVFLDVEQVTDDYGATNIAFGSVGDVTGDGWDDFFIGDSVPREHPIIEFSTFGPDYSIVSGAAIFTDPDGQVKLDELEFPDLIKISQFGNFTGIDPNGDLDGDGLNEVVFSVFSHDYAIEFNDPTRLSGDGTAVLFGADLQAAGNALVKLEYTMLPSVFLSPLVEKKERLRGLKIVGDLDGDLRDDAVTVSEHTLIIWPGSLIAQDLSQFTIDDPIPAEAAEILLPEMLTYERFRESQVSLLEDVDGDGLPELLVSYFRGSVPSGEYLIASRRIAAAHGTTAPLDLRDAFD
ncbi:MAG: cadherin repeat domain-containing protein [Henriciella sp.]